MFQKIGIVRESKPNEKRSHLAPRHVKNLIDATGVQFFVQPVPDRCFSDQEFKKAGAIITENLAACDLIIGFKHVELSAVIPHKNYFFASHMEKGQQSSLPLLNKLLNAKCSLFDAISFDARCVKTGIWAGRVGMLESLYAYNQYIRPKQRLFELKRPFEYTTYANLIAEAKTIKQQVSERLLPSEQIICGLAGSGSVTNGVNDILDLLGFSKVNSIFEAKQHQYPLWVVAQRLVI